MPALTRERVEELRRLIALSESSEEQLIHARTMPSADFPRPDMDEVYEPLDTIRAKQALWDVADSLLSSCERLEEAEGLLERARKDVHENLDASGGCDHSAGICACESVRLLEAIDAFLTESKEAK